MNVVFYIGGWHSMIPTTFMPSGNEILKDNHCQETSDVSEETQEEQGNTQERSRTQVGLSMHLNTVNSRYDDYTGNSVSGDE